MAEVTEDAFLGGKVTIRQPAHGYRAAMDSVLLSAAVPAISAGRVLELGCGVGTALFCYGARVPDVALTGLELDAAAADLARINAAANGFDARSEILTGDLMEGNATALPANGFDQVFANPPYQDAASGSPSPIADRARSNVEGTASLKDWIRAMLRLARPKGGVTLIHRADRLDDILAFLHRKTGEIEVIPLWPRAGVPAKRVIVRARKGVRGGARMHPGLVLHGPGDARYTEAASAILRDGQALP